ncbi:MULTISPECIES: helix-turn-helix domain-containing protein [unclassified Pseudomonas]|uniref:helix-turn-helix domain-containing protein n=1 Tax=unclassified Pseudomonas TaxID=196821 RepID=UPI002449D4B1|nr:MULTISPECIES: helix-turn-helix domain-containing protein [unclassified Pseudomonas]MDG9927437.1 helix-turn-helix domain-containing protein [Pseudomonas sp. GD04042]MDH0482506.1 helix-turn-helix domain-containing protein [Pseudomonas sp. GD04015]MDH0602858.1 helix-turn-helix domain-containing protein [Pseudomonas sp. GD03869]
MSTLISSACWQLQGMSATQKIVLISLADQANDDGVCWPSVGSIARRTCLSARAVQDAIAWLESARVVHRDFRVNSSTSYTVTPADYSPEKAASARKRTNKTTPANGAPHEHDAPPADGAGVQMAHPPQMAHEGGANGAGEVVQMAHPTPANGAPRTVIEPSVEPSRESSSLSPAPSAPPRRRSKPADSVAEAERQSACRDIWSAYSSAYLARYGTSPVRNAKVNRHVDDLRKRLGADAHQVAAYFVAINDAYLIRNCHDFGSLLAKAESYHTQWATNRQVTGTSARQIENTQTNLSAAEQALAEQRARRGPNAHA